MSTDKPVAADFDGDGITDLAVFRPATGVWYIVNPSTGVSVSYGFGLSTDVPVAGDYDGDGKADVAVFRPSTDEWWRISSITGAASVRSFGQPGDTAAPSYSQPQ